MRTVNRPIEVLVTHSGEGEMRPLRFRYLREDEEVVVSVDRILEIRREKSPDHGMTILYRCESHRENRKVQYELRFFVDKMKWHLFRVS